MSDLKSSKKAIYGGSAPSIGAEWRLVGNNNGGYYEIARIPRKCPFDAVLLKPLLKQKGRLLAAGILGIILGITGIHFLLTRHAKKGFVRLGSFLAVGLLAWASFRYLEAGIAFAVLAICTMVGLTLFIFGFEEGVFLCNLAVYDARMAAKRGMSCFLSFRIGRLTIEAIIEILLVVAFIVVAVWLYITYH